MGMIKLPKASITLFKDNLDDIFETGNLAEGQWNKSLSAFVCELTGANYAVPTNSNGSGIVALLQLYNKFNNRSKVLLQSNTMYGVKTMTISAGMEIVGYLDCSIKTLMPTISDVEKAVASINDTSDLVILLTHIGGIINPDIEAIADFCSQKNIILLEDCAHSFGATFNGKHSGLFGDGGVYSFYATKAIPAGEGGIAITKNEEIGKALNLYVMYDRFDQKLDLGVNFRPSEVQALLMYSVAKEVWPIIDNKRRIANEFTAVCRELEIPFLDQETNGQKGNYYKYILLSEGNIHDDLPKLQTMTSKVYDYCLGNSTQIINCHACLPIWYDLAPEATEEVIEELKACKK